MILIYRTINIYVNSFYSHFEIYEELENRDLNKIKWNPFTLIKSTLYKLYSNICLSIGSWPPLRSGSWPPLRSGSWPPLRSVSWPPLRSGSWPPHGFELVPSRSKLSRISLFVKIQTDILSAFYQ